MADIVSFSFKIACLFALVIVSLLCRNIFFFNIGYLTDLPKADSPQILNSLSRSQCLLTSLQVFQHLLSAISTANLRGQCREPARDIPLVTKVMRKEARHTQRRDRASGVPPDILEHLPPKNQSLPTLLLCALTSDFTGSCPPPLFRSLCQRANLQLQLIKFPGN